MIHQSKNERDKYACKFCDKILCYTTSIRRHVQMCHSKIFASLGNNSKHLSQLIRGEDNKQSSKVKKGKISLVSRIIKSKPNCDIIDKEQSNSKVTLKFNQKDTSKLIPKKRECNEEAAPDNVIINSRNIPIAVSSAKNPTSEIPPCETESIPNNEVQGKLIINSPFINPITNDKVEIAEEVKEEKKLRADEIYGQMGDNLDKFYLHAEISDTVPIIDYNTMDHFIYRDIINPFELEDPGISHYEY